MNSVGPLELLVLLFIVAVVVPIWAIVDALMRPDSHWAAADQNKTVWVVVMAIGILVTPIGLVLAVIYLTSIRPKLRPAG